MKTSTALKEFKLCYICPRRPWLAWFTTAELRDQWGDDWNDAPYEHNAGSPYEWDTHAKCEPYELKRVVFHDADLETPAERACGNSSYSVEDMNSGAVAWLVSSQWSSGPKIAINAGVSVEKFKELIRLAGGDVYVKEHA